MGKINRLPRHIADLIAAGEVVDRPASVVKELVENSIDAGAHAITVEIRGGGVLYMRVTDDGCGMSPDDAETAFLRHATSKISAESDLDCVATMGFRGEALAAVAAVARIELQTRSRDSGTGHRLLLESSEVIESEETGCPPGTTVIVRDLFFNTPARMKFLKRDATEAANIQLAVVRAALSHPEISIRFIKDGREELHCPGDGSLASAVYCALGRDFAKPLLEIPWIDAVPLVRGLVAPPNESRSTRNMQFFTVNRRPVRSKTLTAALEEAFKNRVMSGKYPVCVIDIELPYALVDVNVHPAKLEVKFQNERDVFHAVYFAVKNALQDDTGRVHPAESKKDAHPPLQNGATAKSSPNPSFFQRTDSGSFKESYSVTGNDKFISSIPPVTDDNPPVTVNQSPDLYFSSRTIHDNNTDVNISDVPQNERSFTVTAPNPDVTEPSPEISDVSQPFSLSNYSDPAGHSQTTLDNPDVKPWRVVGEVMTSYVVVEQDDCMLLIDKHAAHERIIFERLIAAGRESSGQVLLAPQSVTLTSVECDTLLANAERLALLGFDIESFGMSTLLLREIPVTLDIADAASVLAELADTLQNGKSDAEAEQTRHMLHTIACKAAIKAGSSSAPDELEALIENVMRLPDIKYCPHGRPIVLEFTKKQLDKSFRRI